MSEILLPLCISSLNLLHLCLVSHLGKVIVNYFRLSIEIVKISLSATWCLGRENLCSIRISYFSFRISAFDSLEHTKQYLIEANCIFQYIAVELRNTSKKETDWFVLYAVSIHLLSSRTKIIYANCCEILLNVW